MHITIINDCDSNAINRQAARIGSLFSNCSISTINVPKFTEISTAGNLIDTLDAYEDREGIILANSAPRHGKAKKWKNGTPFGFFKYNNILVITTVDGLTLSLVKKLGLAKEIQLTDIPTVLDKLKDEDPKITEKLISRITNSQFRSFDYEPRLAKWIIENRDIPSETYSLENVPDAPSSIWWTDNFGNCKTTILPNEINFKHGDTTQTNIGKLLCLNRLKDVPNNTDALIIGSSGINDKRFLEIVTQGQSASNKLGIKTGANFEIRTI